MIKKEFVHEKVEICAISKEPINTLKDKYVVLCDCDGNNIHSYKFYKLEYLKELFSGNAKKIRDSLMKQTIEKANILLGNVGLVNNNRLLEAK